MGKCTAEKGGEIVMTKSIHYFTCLSETFSVQKQPCQGMKNVGKSFCVSIYAHAEWFDHRTSPLATIYHMPLAGQHIAPHQAVGHEPPPPSFLLTEGLLMCSYISQQS